MSEEKRSVEVSGRTVEEAIEKGLAQLGLEREAVEVQILSEGSRGILGIGAEKARVLLTPIEPQPEVPSPPHVSQVAKEVLETLLRYMGVEGQVSLRAGNEPLGDEVTPITLDVTGRDLGLLIGRRGETLRALQFITRLLVSRRIHHWANIVVDVERYKERRERTLRDMALRMAERVQLSGRAISLEPMPAHERRIVHLALRNHPAVTTLSVGEGEARKVTIRPRGQSPHLP
ncbi:MAG: RNA-binding cell elongation regulator Jag/EloR [Anaerolineae bacterium]